MYSPCASRYFSPLAYSEPTRPDDVEMTDEATTMTMRRLIEDYPLSTVYLCTILFILAVRTILVIALEVR